MKNLIIKIDEKYFGKFFIKFYRSFYSIKRIQSSHKNWVTTLKDLRQYTLLTYWNMLFNLLETNKVEGDIVECGVGNGTTLSFILFNLVRNDMHRDRLYFGFDSFEGFPEPDLNDKNSIKIIEWPQLIKTNVADRLELHLSYSRNEEERDLTLKGKGKWQLHLNKVWIRQEALITRFLM